MRHELMTACTVCPHTCDSCSWQATLDVYIGLMCVQIQVVSLLYPVLLQGWYRTLLWRPELASCCPAVLLLPLYLNAALPAGLRSIKIRDAELTHI